jgi:phosphate:Na+ symporter
MAGGLMAILNVLAALALLLWGSRQMDQGFRGVAEPWTEALLPHARRGRYVVFGLGLVAGLLRPSERDRLKETALNAAAMTLPPARAFVLLLGANLGAAAATLLLVEAPDWSFHVVTIAGAAATLLSRHARVRHAGRALFGAGLVLLALSILALAALTEAPAPLGAAIAQALEQDALLSVTAGALLVLCLRSVFPAVLMLAITWSAWLQPQAAVAVLLGVHVGGAVMAYAGSGADASARRLGAAQMLATLLTAAGCLLLRADLARLLAGGTGDALVLLNTGVQALTAVAFLNLSGPLTRSVWRWLPATRGTQGVPTANAARLHAGDLERPSVALAAALREVMRVADLVDRMLRMAKDVFLQGDVVAAQAIRDAEQRVNTLYLSLKQYLAQIPRRPLRADEQFRWQELLAFLISAEQVADRIERMLADLESKEVSLRLVYPPDAVAEVLALHEQLAKNLRLAASVCLERRVAAARELAASKEAFRQMERTFRAAHVARLVAGEQATVAISSLHLNLLADFVDMNDQICAFARSFLELRAAPAHAAVPPISAPASTRGALS